MQKHKIKYLWNHNLFFLIQLNFNNSVNSVRPEFDRYRQDHVMVTYIVFPICTGWNWKHVTNTLEFFKQKCEV